MKPVIASLVLSAVACGRYEAVQLQRVAIDNPPPLIAEGTSSNLVVPSSCPVYAPGGGDVDTPEPPFPAGVSIVCCRGRDGEDLRDREQATRRRPAWRSCSGDRGEIGLYVGFELGPSFTPVLTGSNPTVVMPMARRRATFTARTAAPRTIPTSVCNRRPSLSALRACWSAWDNSTARRSRSRSFCNPSAGSEGST